MRSIDQAKSKTNSKRNNYHKIYFLFYFGINRMDEDQCARRNLQLFFGIEDPDYYEFEGWFDRSDITPCIKTTSGLQIFNVMY